LIHIHHDAARDLKQLIRFTINGIIVDSHTLQDVVVETKHTLVVRTSGVGDDDAAAAAAAAGSAVGVKRCYYRPAGRAKTSPKPQCQPTERVIQEIAPVDHAVEAPDPKLKTLAVMEPPSR
jgi:hypothetical protein